jgi:hypothetical protein
MHTGPTAWQPLTPRGVVAFAGARLTRLLLAQAVFAVLTGAAVVWFLHTAWFPTVRAAIRQLPARGEIRAGQLNWAGTSPHLLAEGAFLALMVDPNHQGKVRSPAHIQVEFGRDDVRLLSLFGYTGCAYPKNRIIAFNRSELEPWWGAWEPPISWIALGLVPVALMALWMLLATLGSPVVWMTGFFANRSLGFRASWKIAGAALMPGALLMMVAIVMYGWGMLDLVKFGVISAAHVVVGWIYLVVSPLFAPALSSRPIAQANPFAVSANERTAAAEPATKEDGRPDREPGQ